MWVESTLILIRYDNIIGNIVKIFSGYFVKEKLLIVYTYFILTIVLAIILGAENLANDNPGFGLYDCKRSSMYCKQFLANNTDATPEAATLVANSKYTRKIIDKE